MFDDKLVTIIQGLIFLLINVELLFQLLRIMRDPVNTQHDKSHSQCDTMYHLFFVMLLVIHYASLSGLPFFAKYVQVLNKSLAQKLNFVILKYIGGALMMQTVVG